MSLLEIHNHGPLITATNYWDLPAAQAGKILVSLNAGAFRVLVPRAREAELADMHTAKGVAVSRGPWPDQRLADAFEILFDDGSSDLYAMHLSTESFDRLPTAEDATEEWVCTVWTHRRGTPRLSLSRPCRYRLSRRLPDLRPWEAV